MEWDSIPWNDVFLSFGSWFIGVVQAVLAGKAVRRKR